MVRDIALASSGLLCRKIGGPSVFPPQPPGIWTMIYSNDQWIESAGDDKHRRGLYTFWRRSALHPMFAIFDAPSREECVVLRQKTNTPLQALTTLNDPAFVEAAAALAKRMIAASSDDATARITLGFRLCVSRNPTSAEMERVQDLLNQQLESFRSNPAAAAELTHEKGDGAIQSAAWQIVAGVLLNLDETITKG